MRTNLHTHAPRERETDRQTHTTHAFHTFYQLLSDAQDVNEGLTGYILHLRQYLVVCISYIIIIHQLV
jgi:hypothetical protein